MKQTIFTVYVLMQSQSDCDEAKRICEGYGLPIWDDERAFRYLENITCFAFDNNYSKEFFCMVLDSIKEIYPNKT